MAARTATTACIIFLHGLGDSGAGWSDLQSAYQQDLPHVRWVFPDAPDAPVSCNGGMRMPSWFDLPEIPVTPASPDAAASFHEGVAAVQAIIRAEVGRGTPAARILVGGFSQGGAITAGAVLSYPETLAGGVVLSGWIVDRPTLAGRLAAANAATPFFWGHGLDDNVVTFENARDGAPLLAQLGVPVELKAYPKLAHSFSPQEQRDVLAFLKMRLPREVPVA